LIVFGQFQNLLPHPDFLISFAGLPYRAPASSAILRTWRNVPTVLLKNEGQYFFPKPAAHWEQSAAVMFQTSVSFSRCGCPVQAASRQRAAPENPREGVSAKHY
jgi:hypothetical protein